MNKPVTLLLVLTLAVNAVWVVGAVAGWVSFGKGKRGGVVARAGGGGGGDGALSAAAAREVQALLTTGDAVKLRDGLRAIGLPEDLTRELVSARIHAPAWARLEGYDSAMRELSLKYPYWRRGSPDASQAYATVSQQTWQDIAVLNREAGKQSRQIFGTDGDFPDSSQRNYPFLSAAKAAQLADLESDYASLRSQAGFDMAGFRMPGDEEKLKLIADEKARDMDALLTPEEKTANDLRNSDTARKLQQRLAGFNATQEEYDTIHALQRRVDGQFSEDTRIARFTEALPPSEFQEAQNAAQREADAEIKNALGDERYAEYVRGQRQDYQLLLSAAQRFNLGADIVAQTYRVRDDTATEASRISDDTGMSIAQKTQAYAALAEQATGQIKATLGDEVGDAYINNALTWLKNLPRGGTVSIGPLGNVTVTQPNAGKAGK